MDNTEIERSMVEEEQEKKNSRIEENRKRGYELVVTLPNGLELYKKKNAAGGYTYYGENNGFHVAIWDDCIGTEEELIEIAKDCYKLDIMEEIDYSKEDMLEGNTYSDFHLYIIDRPSIRCTHTQFPTETYMIGDEPDGHRLEVDKLIYDMFWNLTV